MIIHYIAKRIEDFIDKLSKIQTFIFVQGKVVEHSIEDGIISSNQSLVLQSISKVSAGNYTCEAFNSEGSGLSNHVKLNIKCK